MVQERWLLSDVPKPAGEYDRAAVPHRLEDPVRAPPLPALAFNSGRPLRRRTGQGAEGPVALRALVVLVSAPLPAPIELRWRRVPPEPQSHAQQR